MENDIYEDGIISIYKFICSVKDVHEAAYKLNPEYKKFWDNHPEEFKKSFRKRHRLQGVNKGILKTHEALFHLSTFGISYGAKKAFQIIKPSRKKRIEMLVTSEEFVFLLNTINMILEPDGLENAIKDGKYEELLEYSKIEYANATDEETRQGCMLLMAICAKDGYGPAKEFVKEVKEKVGIDLLEVFD